MMVNVHMAAANAAAAVWAAAAVAAVRAVSSAARTCDSWPSDLLFFPFSVMAQLYNATQCTDHGYGMDQGKDLYKKTH